MLREVSARGQLLAGPGEYLSKCPCTILGGRVSARAECQCRLGKPRRLGITQGRLERPDDIFIARSDNDEVHAGHGHGHARGGLRLGCRRQNEWHHEYRRTLVGALKVTPQVELTITLDVARAKDGSLSAKWGSPDQGAKDLPVDSIGLSNGVLTFSAKTAGASFKGTLGKNASDIAGEWLQAGRPLPLTLTRTDPSKTAVAPPIPKSLEGLWHGTLTLNGGLELRLVLKVEPQKDGSLKAILASPDQGAANIPISSILLDDKNTLTFESKAIGAKFAGKRNEKGTAFEGRFDQSGMKMPLTLTKTDKVVERARRKRPKVLFPTAPKMSSTRTSATPFGSPAR